MLFLLFLTGFEALYIITNWYLSAIILILLFHISMIIMLSMYIQNINSLACYINYSQSYCSDIDELEYDNKEQDEQKQIKQGEPQLNTANKIDKVISIILIGIIIVILNFIATLSLIFLEININTNGNNTQKWMYHLHGTVSCLDASIITFCIYLVFKEHITINRTKLCCCYCIHQKCKNKFITQTQINIETHAIKNGSNHIKRKPKKHKNKKHKKSNKEKTIRNGKQYKRNVNKNGQTRQSISITRHESNSIVKREYIVT